MLIRAATVADLPAIAELQRRFDAAWFGVPEHDQNEVRESLECVDPLAEHSRLVVDGDRVLAAAWWWATDATLLVDPAVDPTPIYAELVPWFESQHGPGIEALSQDSRLVNALTARGWRHVASSFEMIRALGADWTLPQPVWPADIVVRHLRPVDSRAVHQLIYRDAGWAEVPGHPERGFDDWQQIFVTAETLPEQQVLAWRGDRLVGVAMGRIFSDGTGWVAQLAVAKDHRGQGLGRALLLEALHRRSEAGARALGLSVQAENRNALSLYLGVGLTLDREWQLYR